MTVDTPPIVLITRLEPGLSEIQKQVAALGWEGMACPVMTVSFSAPFPIIQAKALAITSAQALPSLRHQPKDSLLLTVGEKTAQRAREAGFMRVFPAKGTRESLKELCASYCLKGEEITFICGRGWKGQPYSQDVAKALGARWLEGYRVKRVEQFSDNVERALISGRVKSVLFYSAETVRSFLAICSPAVMQQLMSVRAFCLSEAIAQAAQKALWKDVVSGSPIELLAQR